MVWRRGLLTLDHGVTVEGDVALPTHGGEWSRHLHALGWGSAEHMLRFVCLGVEVLTSNPLGRRRRF